MNKEYVTTYKEEIEIKTLIGHGQSLKAAVEKVLPWLEKANWAINQERYPQIIALYHDTTPCTYIAIPDPKFQVCRGKYSFALIDSDGEVAYFVDRKAETTFVDPRWAHLISFFEDAYIKPL